MHYVNLSDVVSLRVLSPEATLLLYVYQLDDPTWSYYEKFRYHVFLRLTSFSKLIDRYVVPSYHLSKELYRIINSDKIKVLEPYFPCNKNLRNLFINNKIKYLESKQLNILYVGRINKYRFDVATTIKVLKHLADEGFHITFRLISMKEMGLVVQHKILESGKLKIELIGKRLTESEKAEIYGQSHILFFACRGYSAMRPPLSIIEAISYGTVPLISPVIAEFASIGDIVVENLNYESLEYKIKHIASNFKSINDKIFIPFSRFYSKDRFYKQLISILDNDYR
jgi:hypothetical protein